MLHLFALCHFNYQYEIVSQGCLLILTIDSAATLECLVRGTGHDKYPCHSVQIQVETVYQIRCTWNITLEVTTTYNNSNVSGLY